MSLFCHAVHGVFSSFAIISLRERELVALLLSYGCECSVSLTASAVVCYVVCDYGTTFIVYQRAITVKKII